MLYVDYNVFLYPVIYDLETVPKAARAKSFLREITLGRVYKVVEEDSREAQELMELKDATTPSPSRLGTTATST